MSNEELKEIFKFTIYSKDCEAVTKKINSINDPYILHVLAYNLEYHSMHYYNSCAFCIEEAITDNPVCDLGTAMLLFYFKGGLGYLYGKGVSYNKIISVINKLTANKEEHFLEKLYTRIMGNNFKTNISYKPKLGKIEFSALEKRNPGVSKIFLEKTPGVEYSIPKIWYKQKSF
jgi:hypothetical protein